MVLFLHNRYRSPGGEERVVEDLLWLVREQLGEPAELIARDSAAAGRAGAARGLLGGGLDPGEVARAVRARGARVLHAHNLQPLFGWRALAAARRAGARVVLHLHQYRLVCAIGVCYRDGAECTRCHGRNTLPGLRRNCRGSLPEAAAYAASLALWQRRMLAQADAIVVPSAFAAQRLGELGAPIPSGRLHVLPPPVRAAGEPRPGATPVSGSAAAAVPREASELPAGPFALVVSRLSPEKGVEVAIDACRLAGVPLVVAGEGPEREALQRRAAGSAAHFLGHVPDELLGRLRARAALALAPSRSAETFGLGVAEAMAAGLPVVASRVGALSELLPAEALVGPGDAPALAAGIGRLYGDRSAGEAGRRRIAGVCGPVAVARALAAIYDGREPAVASP